MISESMALKLGIRPGDLIDLPEPMGSGWAVLGSITITAILIIK